MDKNYSILPISELKTDEKYFIIFILKGRRYAVSINDTAEIINIQEADIPETAPEGIIGMFNYKGSLIKAVDLCPFLGFETPDFAINSRMIVIHRENEFIAVHTENIENIQAFEEDKIQPMPYSGRDSILSHICKSEEGSISIIDTGVLFELVSRKNTPRSSINYAAHFPSDEKSRQILLLRAQHSKALPDAFTLPENAETSRQYILFIMDGQNYYLDIQYIKEFLPAKRLNIAPLPYTPDYIKGIAGIKGEFMLAVDLNRFINPKSPPKTDGGKIITASCRNFNIAFIVDDIKYIRNLNDIRQAELYSSNRKYIYAEFMENDKLCSIIDFKQIINDDRLYINIE